MPPEIIILILYLVSFTYAIYLRFCIVPGLRKRLKAAETKVAQLSTPKSPEVERLRERVQVLERIATDKASTLDREIDELRTAG